MGHVKIVLNIQGLKEMVNSVDLTLVMKLKSLLSLGIVYHVSLIQELSEMENNVGLYCVMRGKSL